MTGRPTKLTPATHDRIVKFIQAGNYLATAAQAAGISEGTLHGWMRRGREEEARREAGGEHDEDEQRFLYFLQSVKRAEAEALARNIAIINNAATKHWQAAAWYAERKAPKQWGNRVNIDATVEVKNASLDDSIRSAMGFDPEGDDDAS